MAGPERQTDPIESPVDEDAVLNEVLRTAVKKLNRRSARMGGQTHGQRDNSRYYLKSVNAGNGMTLNAMTSGNTSWANQKTEIDIAIYSPGDLDNIIFPDLLSPADMDTVRDAAWDKRVKALDDFNRGKGPYVRTDYFHPDVIALHREHNSFFQGTPLRKILEAYNESGKEIATRHLHADELTRAAVCLMPGPEVQGRPKDLMARERYIGLRVLAPFTKFNAPVPGEEGVFDIIETRLPVRTIPMAKRTEEGIEVVEGMGGIFDLDAVAEMASDVMAISFGMEIDGLKFDTNELGIVTMPPNMAV
jgi:hypothetical protein